ncbi:MAG: mannitol dehydrogenase family protein, partial [Mangrovicoccus sp.]
MMTLNFENLDQLPPRIERPGHDPRAVSPGILHIGLGNFHRAHQALYLHDLMGCGLAMDWGILGAGVMPSDAQMRSDLEAQDWLFTVVEQDAEQETARICAAMTGFVPVAPDHAPMRSAMEDPAIRIVSLTVTEGGYFLDSSGQPDLAHAALQADIRSPDTPATAFGAIVAGLRARRDAGQAPFTVMCCDNLPHNGVITKTLIQAIAEAQDPKLGAWIGENVSFPNAMV